jgi:hypothetical protein
MQAVTHAAPVFTLELLNVESPSEYQQAQQHNAEKTDIHSPQYVPFYFQGQFLPAIAFAKADSF